MADDIHDVIARAGGAASRALLYRAAIPRTTIDHYARRGELQRIFPRVYVDPVLAELPAQLELAALRSVGGRAALTHLSALRRWELGPQPADVHLLVPADRSLAAKPGLVLHRTRRFPPVVEHYGVPVVAAPDAIVRSWPLIRRQDRRSPAITAVRRRLVTPSELRAALRLQPRLRGHKEVAHLIALLEAGCESELEIWGLLGVFDVPGLDHGVRQKQIRAGSRSYRLDLAYERERVAVELDGDRYHSTREQRERDRARDSALAAIGWLTLRFSYQRLHNDVAGCRRETLATLAARRA